jgi:replication factor C subunit 3/5
MSKGIKLVILDECDSMTSAAQFALRRIVEKYTKTTRFCLICNYVSKIIPALQSRCTRFRFGPLDDTSVLSKLNEVANSEELKLETGADKAIVSLSGGDMRKVLNILESCSLAYKQIPVTKIYEVTGRPSPQDISTIYTALTTQTFNGAMDLIWALSKEKSLAFEDIIREIHQSVMATKLPD